ncbi:hypothetical protein BOX15_Mlig003026g2 [Macrostomum lignano]|uniref:Ral GTPase-activating protein subunit alpha/beta N-terminal domain-containing protein n=1 Tax=Macrostomum lignano TaxID=282301 RepID=A0A267ELD7_9PLAT|nr:hypothetical protein BOX15_Mlig003026g2 [Macrostomum lignano]
MFSRRPNDRNRFDSKRVTQKVLEHKKDSATRLKHLKNFLDNTNEIEAQQFFKANYSLIFFLFYDFFIQVEAELKQRVNKAHKEELESAICIFEKILIFLPELIRRRWQFHCIGRLLSKLLHSQNALRTRKDGVRLFIMFYQIMGCGDEPAPNECHRMFAALVPQLASDLTPEQCPLSGGAFAVAFAGTRPPRSPNNSSGGGEHHHQCGGGGVNPVELSPMLSKTSAPESETPKDQTEDLLDHLLTCIVSETHKILWEQDCHRQHRDCFAYLFRSFQRYYIDALFPRLNRQFSIYDSRQLVIAEVDDWKRVLSEYGKFGEVRLLQGSLYPYQTVVLNWLTRFVIVHKEEAAGRNGKQQRDKDHTASNASAGSALTTSGGTGSAAGEASAGGSAASAAGSSGGGGGASSSIGGGSSGVGGSSGASATDSAGCCDQADAADAAAVHAAAVHAAAAGAMLPDEVPGSNASTLSSQNTNNSDPNDPGGAASAAAGGAASSSLQHRFTDTQIANVRDVLYSRRSSVNLVHELFRQAFLFPIEFHHTIRSVVAAYDSWLSAKGSKRPPFMMEPQLPNPALDPGIAQSASEHQMLPQPEEDARSSHTPPSESSPGRRSVRSDSYLTAVVDDESGGQAAAAPVEAGYHCIVQVFFSNSASVFFVPTREPLQRKDLLSVAQKILQMLRHAVIHMQQAMARMANTTSHDALMQLYNLQQPTWNQLLNVLFTIASKLYSNPRSEDSVAAMIANNFLQTLFTTWLYALHYSNISDCMWDRLVEVLSKLTRWSPLIIEWNKTLEFCTKKLASDVYKLDLQNLPMDRLVSGPKRVKRKEKDRSRGGGGSSHGTPQRHQHSHGGGGGRLAGLEAAAAAAAAGPSGRHIGVADSFSLQKIEDNSSSIRKQLTEGSPSPSQLTASTAASTAPAAKATLLMTASGAAASAAAEKLLAASAASAAAPSASLSYSDSESISAASTAEFGFQQQQQQQPQQVTRSLGNTRETSLEPAGTPSAAAPGAFRELHR